MANAQEQETSKTQKGDFIELEFLGRNSIDQEVFDTNILEEAKKINPDIKETKPLIICIGKGMVVSGFDQELEDKELDKKYSIKLGFEKAFGKRNPTMIKMINKKSFIDQKINPQPGMSLALDNNIVKIVSVSGGRVMVDFNNPLAGKDVEYDFIIKSKVTDPRVKVNAIQRFLFGNEFEFDLEDSGKKVIFKDIKLAGLLQAFRPQFQEFLGMDVEILEKPAKKDNKEENEKSKEKKKEPQEEELEKKE